MSNGLLLAQVLAISRYDGRGTMSIQQDSVKSQHILPFFPNFILLATRLENLLVGMQGEPSGNFASSAYARPVPLSTPL